MAECVKLENICKSYGRRKILNNVNLTANTGELIVIKGKSGSGKSTLLNIIGQLDGYDEGDIYFDSARIKHEYERNRLRSEKIGFVFQSYWLLENLNIRDNIKMPYLYTDGRMPKDLNEWIDELLGKFGLEELIHQKTRNLSGGEKQRVAIARAMIRKPQLIVADEPTGNLDNENSEKVSSILRDYADSGNTVIVVTHSETNFENADHIYRLEDGRLV